MRIEAQKTKSHKSKKTDLVTIKKNKNLRYFFLVLHVFISSSIFALLFEAAQSAAGSSVGVGLGIGVPAVIGNIQMLQKCSVASVKI